MDFFFKKMEQKQNQSMNIFLSLSLFRYERVVYKTKQTKKTKTNMEQCWIIYFWFNFLGRIQMMN